MTDNEQPAVTLPQYSPPNPKGIPVADRRQARFLFKAVRSLGKLPRTVKKIRKKGLESDQNVHIKRKRPIFY